MEITLTEEEHLKPFASGLYLISLPEVQNLDEKLPEIFVGRQLNNEVLFYIKTDKNIKNCFMDSDISTDTNHDGDPRNDKDFGCNRIITQQYTPKFESIIGRIYYKYEKNKENKRESKDFLVSFADFEHGLDEASRKQYSLVSELINSIDDSSSLANADLRSLLIILRNTLGDKNAQRGNLIQIEEFMEKNPPKLTEKQEEKLRSLINSLSDYATLSAKGAGTYDIAKEEILSLLPLELKKKIINGFTTFENIEGGSGLDLVEARRQVLESIAATIYEQVAKSDQDIGENEIAKDDYQNIVKTNICKIANEYTLITELCNDFNKNNPDFKSVPKVKNQDTS